MSRGVYLLLLTAAVWGSTANVALAGMPSIHLNDLARMRLQTISFFGLGFVLSACLIRFIWNRLTQDFAWLPKLGVRHAFGLVALWGLFFVLVLTMISGARELLTPGAWKKDGLTYKLAEPPPANPSPSAPEENLEQARQMKLQDLRFALWQYAQTHEGRFPPSTTEPGIRADLWRVPGPTGATYRYVAGRVPNQGAELVAFEPEVFDGSRWAILSNGELRRMANAEITKALTEDKP